ADDIALHLGGATSYAQSSRTQGHSRPPSLLQRMRRVSSERSVGAQQLSGKCGHLQSHFTASELANRAFGTGGVCLQAASEVVVSVVTDWFALDGKLCQRLPHCWISVGRSPIDLPPSR